MDLWDLQGLMIFSKIPFPTSFEMPFSSALIIKVDVIESNKEVTWTPIFQWYVVRRGSKIGHQKDMCQKEIGLLI